ncbi:MAG: aspartyl/asparaginyl beta-hydroxylase domain-containing protein [Sphingomonadaceae bacterium]|nr:aspartyl/asparaginyl beta-hydroxylase domain-containing protein [Sphingomonadaceae bacterium]
MENAPPNSAQSANAEGLAALRAGDFARAAACFATATVADPHAGSLWRNLAHARRELGDDAGERAALQSALNVDQRDLPALIRLAQNDERCGQMRDAMLHWGAVLQLGAAVPNPSPDFAAILRHAEAYSTAQRDRLAQTLDAGLGAQLSRLGATDARRTRAFLDSALGLRRIYQNDCAGLYYPFLPPDEFFDAHHFPWFADLRAAAPAIREELSALIADPGEAMRPYVRMGEGVPDSKWSTLDNKLDWGACFLWEYGSPNQPVLDRCPATAAALAAVPSAHIPGRAPSAFFSILQPHTHIPPHTGVSNTRAIIHLPLIVPEKCGFRVGGETRAWVEGEAFAFDDTIDHEAWNDSDEVRGILIFDVWNPHLSVAEQEIIARYFDIADNLGG